MSASSVVSKSQINRNLEDNCEDMVDTYFNRIERLVNSFKKSEENLTLNDIYELMYNLFGVDKSTKLTLNKSSVQKFLKSRNLVNFWEVFFSCNKVFKKEALSKVLGVPVVRFFIIDKPLFSFNKSHFKKLLSDYNTDSSVTFSKILLKITNGGVIDINNTHYHFDKPSDFISKRVAVQTLLWEILKYRSLVDFLNNSTIV